jgi:hypothetical protein
LYENNELLILILIKILKVYTWLSLYHAGALPRSETIESQEGKAVGSGVDDVLLDQNLQNVDGVDVSIVL